MKKKENLLKKKVVIINNREYEVVRDGVSKIVVKSPSGILFTLNKDRVKIIEKQD